MGLFEHFPYTNFHELNLDWVLNFVKKVRDRLDLIDKAVEDAQEARDDSENFALDAEAWAWGKRNGVDVPEDAPQYETNALHYARLASGFADGARYQKEQAETWASQASDMAGNALNEARNAEAWATGNKNGVPVASDAEQYENNAKYYAEQASQAGSGYGIANAAYFRVNNVQVLAARNVYNGSTLTRSLNVPGLIAVVVPFHNTGSSANDAEAYDVGMRLNNSEYITAFVSSQESEKYVILPYDPGVVVTIIDNDTQEVNEVKLFRVFDITTGQFAADSTTLNILFTVVRSKFTNNGQASNQTAIGGYWPQAN